MLMITELLRNGEKTSLLQGKTGTLKGRQQGLLLRLYWSGGDPCVRDSGRQWLAPGFDPEWGAVFLLTSSIGRDLRSLLGSNIPVPFNENTGGPRV